MVSGNTIDHVTTILGIYRRKKDAANVKGLYVCKQKAGDEPAFFDGLHASIARIKKPRCR
jgi:hypothetical protein